jgi:hypothetical protein
MQCAPFSDILIIVIDGLDECVEEKEQTNILSLINDLARLSICPFRFIVASRPEYSIRTAFSQPSPGQYFP